eukprot:g11015.t1
MQANEFSHLNEKNAGDSRKLWVFAVGLLSMASVVAGMTYGAKHYAAEVRPMQSWVASASSEEFEVAPYRDGMGSMGDMGSMGGNTFCRTVYYKASEVVSTPLDAAGDFKVTSPLRDYASGQQVGVINSYSFQYSSADGQSCYKIDFTLFYEPLLEQKQLNTLSMVVPACNPTANPPFLQSWFKSEVRAYAGFPASNAACLCKAHFYPASSSVMLPMIQFRIDDLQ